MFQDFLEFPKNFPKIVKNFLDFPERPSFFNNF